MQYLWDTDTCIALMKNHPHVIARASAVAPGDCMISSITAYELFTGIAKCADPARELAKVELLLKTVVEIPFDAPSARRAGEFRATLESRGEMIGPYDILLAGQAVAASFTMVTANVSEFRRLPGLRVENWLEPT